MKWLVSMSETVGKLAQVLVSVPLKIGCCTLWVSSGSALGVMACRCCMSNSRWVIVVHKLLLFPLLLLLYR